MSEPVWLVVGLGNPGPGYAGNRHNVGAMVLDLLAGRVGGRFKAHKGRADLVEGRLCGQRALLAKPKSYMNLSGGPVASLRDFFRVPVEHIVVVHDELDIPYGVLRLKAGGGDNGHNGLKSVTSALGSKDYLRVRVGIGRPPGRQEPADYVLKDFAAAERKDLGYHLDRAADAVEALLTGPLEAAQNTFHVDVPLTNARPPRRLARRALLRCRPGPGGAGQPAGRALCGADPRDLHGRHRGGPGRHRRRGSDRRAARRRTGPRRWLGPAVAVGGALLLAARPTVFAVGDVFRGTGPVGTVALVLLAVAPSALVLSTVTPGVVKLRLRTLAETGQTVGRLSAAGTLGALAGTFLTGFVLLAALPTSTLLLLTGVVLIVVGVTVAVTLPKVAKPVPLAGVVALGVLAAGLLVVVDGPCQVETRYYCATVQADPNRAGGRTLVLDGLRHSYVDLDDPAYLEFSYTRRIGDVLAVQPPGPLSALHLGGGGFSVPRHLAVVRPGSRSKVLEVDPQIPEIGRDRLGLVTGPDLAVMVGDARTSIAAEPSGTYDVVVGDAFGSLAVPWHLTTAEMVADVRRVLRPGGVYVLNVIDYPPLGLARAETATLLAAFSEVALMAPPSTVRGESGGNLVLVASDRPIAVDRLGALAASRGEPGSIAGLEQVRTFAGDAAVLTDDDAPVDQLLTPYSPPRT